MEVVSTTDVPPNILVIDPRKKRKAKKEKPPPLRSPSGTIIKRPRGRPRVRFEFTISSLPGVEKYGAP